MIKRIKIFLFVVVVIICIAIFSFLYKPISNYLYVNSLPDYYKESGMKCLKIKSVGCDGCLNSVKIMAKNNYLFFDNNKGCPAGYQFNALDCIGSYSWCENNNKNNI